MLITACKQIILEMLQRKLRSFLAMFGIFWGTLAIILLLALSNGFYSASKKNVESIASGVISIMPGATGKTYKGRPSGQRILISLDEVLRLKQAIPDIKWVSPVLGEQNFRHYLSYKQKTTNKSVLGVGPHSNIFQLKLITGSRFIDQNDIKQATRVVVLGAQLKRDLFGTRSALNKTVKIDGIPFKVVGVSTLKSSNKAGSGGSWRSIQSYIPYSTYKQLFGADQVRKFLVMPQSVTDSKKTKANIISYLALRHNFDPKDTNALFIPDFGKAMQFFNWFFNLVQGFLGFCGFMTLAVGAIGVANIMFLIVTERTREIGLRMALGAQDFHIMLQVLLESVIIVLCGGIAAIFVGITIVHGLNQIQLPSWLGQPAITVATITFVVCVLLIISFLAGIMPARKAAKMQPVEALGF